MSSSAARSDAHCTGYDETITDSEWLKAIGKGRHRVGQCCAAREGCRQGRHSHQPAQGWRRGDFDQAGAAVEAHVAVRGKETPRQIAPREDPP